MTTELSRVIMEFISSMREIVTLYQKLPDMLRSGLVIILFRSLKKDLQQSVFTDIIKHLQSEQKNSEVFSDSEDDIESLCEDERDVKISSEMPTTEMKRECATNIEETSNLHDGDIDTAEEVVEETVQSGTETKRREIFMMETIEAAVVVETAEEKPASAGVGNMSAIDKSDSEKEEKKPEAAETTYMVSMDKYFKLKQKRGRGRPRKSTPSKDVATDSVRAADYTCVHCDHVFASKFSLQRHQEKHRQHGAGAVFCMFCKKRDAPFSDLADLQRHRRLQHPDRATCHRCHMTFPNRAGLQKHEATHEKPEKKMYCNYCGDDFSQMSNLKYHIRRHHTGEKPYGCGICKESFFDISSLMRHEIRQHPGQHVCKCEVCGEEFCSRKELSEHRKSAHCEEDQQNMAANESP